MALAVAALSLAQLAAAQTGATVTIRHLQTEAFPIIAGYVAARDAAGAPLTGLEVSELNAVEDGTERPLTQLRAVNPGLRIIFVLNPSESFAIRDSQARTRFDYVREAVLAWANQLPSNNSSLLSLILPDGVLLQDALAADWATTLQNLPTSFGGLQVTTESLLRAMELAAVQPTEPGQGSAIWWVTATPTVEELAAIPEWQAALNELGVPVFIWQIDSPVTFESPAAQLLKDFAAATGGQWFGFSAVETFPEPEDYFFAYRTAYFFQYNSQLHTAGTHEVLIALESEVGSARSQPRTFDLSILPPNPILVSPPTQIERGPSQEDPQELSPFSQPVEIVVEFPDEIERQLVRTTLFVNDQPVAENTAAPFTRFAWDLTGYTLSQQVLLRVEAEDELGLSGTSIEFPVQVLVENPLPWYQVLLARGGPVLAVFGVLLAAGALGLILVISGRLRPMRRSARRQRRAQTVQATDPLSDSPLALDAPPTEYARAAPAFDAPAYLQRLNMQSAGGAAELLPLSEETIAIGAASGNQLVLREESVDDEHARLERLDDGAYHVTDFGSEAGTWVNYAPVSAEGSHLRDGDLLHIGRIAFRFLINTNYKTDNDPH